jgi:hypothetical protein
MLADVTVETARRPGIRRKGWQRGGWIRARQMDAIVAKEHAEPVGRVGVTGEVRRGGRDDFHAPAQSRVPRRQALPERGRLREADRQQVDVG